MNIPKIVQWSPLWAVLLIICNTLVLWHFIPPFQSPDEFVHIKRAYLLTQGKIILDTPKDSRSGGLIDQGLLDFMDVYMDLARDADQKVTDQHVYRGQEYHWTHTRVFESASGAGYYFPLIYFPQAFALAIGEQADLSIATSYHLARVFVLIAVVLLLWGAFSLYPVPPWVLATLFLPMTAFQCASASLDAMAIALSVFSIAAFHKMILDRQRSHTVLFYAGLATLSIVVSSRLNLFPLFVLPLYAAVVTRRLDYGFSTLIMFVLNLCWVVIAAKTTVHGATVIDQPVGQITTYYLTHPSALAQVLYATKANIPGWAAGFIGNLGWLDAPFSLPVYVFFVTLYGSIMCLSYSTALLKKDPILFLLLIGSAVASVGIILIALLITFTPHPAVMITGVQGRYFLIPMIMLAYAFSGQPGVTGYGLKAFLLVILLSTVTLIGSTNLLIARYY